MDLARVFFPLLAATSFHLLALAVREAPSCATIAEARQLDYWLGDWVVVSPGSPGTGHSTVYLSLDKCLLIESWGSNVTDHQGQNALAYNSEDKTWYGLFVDNRGRVHALRGTTAPGSAALEGPSHDEGGKPVLKRIRVVRVDANTVEQIWETLPDSGASWSTDFRMHYSRRKP